MKKVYIIVFHSESELLNGSERITEQFVKFDNSKVYCGAWGEIKFNKEECLNVISSTVNHFIQLPEKKEIYFGCSHKDALEIEQLILVEGCEVIKISYNDFMKSYTF